MAGKNKSRVTWFPKPRPKMKARSESFQVAGGEEASVNSRIHADCQNDEKRLQAMNFNDGRL